MTQTADSPFDQGIAHHRGGDLAAAEPFYHAALAVDAADPRATQMLGVLAFQTGRPDMAVGLLRRAAELSPTSADCLGNLGQVLAAAGHADEAADAYRRAVAVAPDFAGGHFNLGLLAADAGRWGEAVAALRRTCDLRPGGADEHVTLADTLVRAGDWPAAADAYARAVELRPDAAEAHYNRAVALRTLDRRAEAIVAVRAAVALRPTWPEAWNNLAVWLHESGDLAGAAAATARALAARPDYAEAYGNLGGVLRQAGRVADAIAAYRRAVVLRPDYAEAWSNLGATLARADVVDEAIAALRHAVTIRPDLSEAHNNLGNVLKDIGDLDGALACWSRAVALRPDDAAADSNRVYTLLYHPAADAAAHRDAAVAWARRHAAPLARHAEPDRTTGRRLRIGYVAPDFRDHCQSFFTLPLLANHDRDQVEVTCYADVAVPDAVTRRLRGCADQWRDTVGLTDAAVADQIRADRIDVLVDLTVHMAHHRLLAFAGRPAPVQVTWLGYPGTTGMAAIDYRFSDPHLDPVVPGRDELYVERTVRLPDTFWCYDPLTDGPPVGDLPAGRGGPVTFGCLNNFCKVTADALRLWAAVLNRVPGSRLVLLAPAGSARQRVLDILGHHCVVADRIEFVGRQSRRAYLDTYRRIDLGLDTVPYSGHTTSLDAAWMGVPVVTRVGHAAVGRAGLSQLSNLGLTDLAAEDDDGFVATAVELAGDRDRLAELRATLRDRLRASPLCDGPRFARHVEAAFRQMWAARCRSAD